MGFYLYRPKLEVQHQAFGNLETKSDKCGGKFGEGGGNSSTETVNIYIPIHQFLYNFPLSLQTRHFALQSNLRMGGKRKSRVPVEEVEEDHEQVETENEEHDDNLNRSSENETNLYGVIKMIQFSFS